MSNSKSRDNQSQKYVEAVYRKWLEIFKRSSIVYLVLLAISEGKQWSGDILRFLSAYKLAIKPVSLYRLLRRLEFMDLIAHKKVPGEKTALARKIFYLTPDGLDFLKKVKEVVRRVGMAGV